MSDDQAEPPGARNFRLNAVIDVPAHENDVVRVFALSMTAAEARALRRDDAGAQPRVDTSAPRQDDTSAESAEVTAQARILGLKDIDPRGVQVFPIADLGDLGLAGFLQEGLYIDAAQIKFDRSRLAGVDGWVMLVHSSAFGAAAARLTPDAKLTLIGTYQTTETDTQPITLHSEAAQPFSGPPAAEAAPLPRQRGGSIMIALFVLVCAGVLWWALA